MLFFVLYSLLMLRKTSPSQALDGVALCAIAVCGEWWPSCIFGLQVGAGDGDCYHVQSAKGRLLCVVLMRPSCSQLTCSGREEWTSLPCMT